jgi:hypothetical protein
MSTPTSNDVFPEVVNDLMQELHQLSLSTQTIFQLITNNTNSHVLAEIQHLSLSKLDAKQMATLLPALAKMTGLTSLTLSESKPSPAHLKFLFTKCPALSKLQSLDLTNSIKVDSNALKQLSTSTNLVNLTSLNFHRCSNISSGNSTTDSGGLIALLSSPVVKNLAHLDLGYTRITVPAIFTTLAASPHLSNLVSLNLSASKIGPDAVAALAASTILSNLIHLNLSQTWLNDNLLAQLFSPPSVLGQKLQSLNLSRTNITVSSLKVVLKACPHLTELILEWNEQFGPTEVAFIATHMPNLTKLNLTGRALRNGGYATLAGSTVLTNLRELNLTCNRTTTQSILALVNSPAMANLTHLDLSNTHDGPEVLTAIAQSASMSKLEDLKFSFNQFGAGDDGVIALAESKTLTNLISLDLSRNNIGPEGVKALCTSPVVSKLTSLNLRGNERMGNSIASVLAAPSSTLYSLLELDLGNIGMGDGGALQLLATPNLDQLNVLAISGNPTNRSTQDAYLARFGVDL